MRWLKAKSKRRGQALVEFALVFPLVLLLIFVALQVLQIGLAQSILSAAAAEAARSASVHDDLPYINVLLDGSTVGLRTREQAVETVVDARVRHTLPILANTTAKLDSTFGDVNGDDGTHHVAIQDVVTLQANVQVLPFLPISNITIKAVGRSFRSDWVDAVPKQWVPDGSCYLAASVSPSEPIIGADTLTLNVHAYSYTKDGGAAETPAHVDYVWHMNGDTAGGCDGSGDFTCPGPAAIASGDNDAFATVRITASACNNGMLFELRLPFFPHK